MLIPNAIVKTAASTTPYCPRFKYAEKVAISVTKQTIVKLIRKRFIGFIHNVNPLRLARHSVTI